MKIAYVNSICHRYDAISNAIHDEIDWLTQAGHEVRLFAYSCQFDNLPCTIVNNEGEVALHPFFQQCDAAVFHFGVYYPLFNLLPVVPRRARRLVVFHNVTPKAVAPLASHRLIDLSFGQMNNIAFADHAICDSQTNLEVLRAVGVNVPATVLPLAVHCAPAVPADKPSFHDGIVRVAFIGRLVASKGPLDLLAALEHLLDADPALRMRLDMVANLHFSDHIVADAVRARLDDLLARFGPRLDACLEASASEACKLRILRDADLFALPTRHEGFCVPVLEAFASGCEVICYDNSNLPSICGGLGELVPTGDIAALTRAIAAVVAQSSAPAWRQGGYAAAVRAKQVHLSQFSVENVRRRFLTLIRQHGHRPLTEHHA
jgi:glycosyltransferase involved in cell wall biosynthesis